jgi:C_GCAxxG_C_C family probable redox protein
MNKPDEAYCRMVEHRVNCAQTVLTTYCEMFGLDRILALQLAQGFGRGMGCGENNCGAVSGAYMVIGLAHKITADNPRQNLEKIYEMTQVFNRKFVEIHSSLICNELVGYDLSSPEGLADARSKSVFTTLCPGFVRDSAKILESLLQID